MPLGRNSMYAAAKKVKNLGLPHLSYLVPDLCACYGETEVNISND